MKKEANERAERLEASNKDKDTEISSLRCEVEKLKGAQEIGKHSN